MTTLTITPNWKSKTARFKGTIAAGEHVAVSIANDESYIADTTNLRLRVVNPANGKTLAQFPMPVEEGETPDEWDSDLTPLSCELDLNTVQMLMAVPPAANVPLLFVLDAYKGATDEVEGEFTLYFKDFCEVTHWPRRVGEEEPTNLDDYKDIIADFETRLGTAEDSIAEAVDDAEAAVATVDGVMEGWIPGETLAERVAADVEDEVEEQLAGKVSKSGDTMTGGLTVPNLTVGSRASGSTVGENSTAEGYKTEASGENSHAEGKSSVASGLDSHAEGFQTVASGGYSHAEGGQTTASGKNSHAEGSDTLAQNNSEHAEGIFNVSHTGSTDADKTLRSVGFGTASNSRKNAVETMQDGKTFVYGIGGYDGTNPTGAGVKDLAAAVATCVNGGSYDSNAKKILLKHDSTTVAEIDATAFIKDGMVSSVEIDDGNLDITFNTDAGQDPISIPLTDIFNPANYYDKTAADAAFVAKVEGKGLSTEDYTTAEKTKLSGIAAGAEVNAIATVKVDGTALTPDADKAVNIDLSGKQDTISDLASIRSGAAAGATAYQKPSDGIPASDLAAAVQTSLGKADTALQQHQDISGKADKVANAVSGNLAALDANGNLADSGNYVNGDIQCSGVFKSGYLNEEPGQNNSYAQFEHQGDGSTRITIVDSFGTHDVYIPSKRDNNAPLESIVALEHEIAPVFDDSDTYEVGDLVYYAPDVGRNRTLYRCTTAVAVAGAWTGSTNWTAASVEDVLAALRTALAGKQDALSAAQIANIAAVPNKADAAALRYDLPTNATAITTASQETVEGETVNYGAATLADRTGNRVSITAALDELRVTFPPVVSGKLRDFGLRVEVGTGSAALTAPALVPVAPTGETIKLENNAKQIPALADGTATAKGVTLLYFSESAPGVFFAKGEQVEEVA